MAILAAVYHLTHYKYDRPVVLGPQIIRLQPAPHSRTKVLSHSLKVEPANHFVNVQQDPYGNFLARFVFPEPVHGAEDRGRSRRRHDGLQPVRLLRRAVGARPGRSTIPRTSATTSRSTARRSRPGRCCRHSSPRSTGRTTQHGQFRRRAQRAACSARSATSSAWRPACMTPEETLARGKGSCRDSSWLLVQALRNLGIAARFVSGYLIQLKPDLVALDGPPGTARRLHRPACLVRGLSAGRRLDRARPDLRPADRRKPCAAGRDAALPQRRADLGHGDASPMSSSPSTCASTASPSIRASPSRSPTRSWAGARRARRGGRRRAAGRGRPPDHGRRADLRVDRRFRRRASGTPPPSARPSARRPTR